MDDQARQAVDNSRERSIATLKRAIAVEERVIEQRRAMVDGEAPSISDKETNEQHIRAGEIELATMRAELAALEAKTRP